MAKPGKLPHTKKQLAALDALEREVRRLGLKVSTGRSLRFAGLKLRGGQCLLRGQRWVILDRTQPFEEQVDIYRQALAPEVWAGFELPTDLRAYLSPYFQPEPLPEGEEPRQAP